MRCQLIKELLFLSVLSSFSNGGYRFQFPAEILERIFKMVEYKDEYEDWRSGHDTINYTSRHRQVAISSMFFTCQMEEFANYRLVSRQWKLVADRFLFQDIYIMLPDRNDILDGEETEFVTEDAGWSFLNMIFHSTPNYILSK